jgi:hypothetical protein
MTGMVINMGILKRGNVTKYKLTNPATIHTWKRARELVVIVSPKESADCAKRAAIVADYNFYYPI